MALFEFEDGHLVPAQFGYPVSHDLGPELVDAICQQVLQIVSRPLFPVTWRDAALDGAGRDGANRLGRDPEAPRLRDPHYVTVASGSRGVAVLVGSGG